METYFLGIVPSEEVKQICDPLREIYAPKHSRHIELHITVKPPIAFNDEDVWLYKLGRRCMDISSFVIELHHTQYFGNRKVLSLNVKSSGLHQLHRQLINELSEIPNPRPYHEGEQYSPHLTLAMQSFGTTPDKMSEFEQRLQPYLPFEPFPVTFVRVYKKQGKNSKWQPFIDLPLKV